MDYQGNSHKAKEAEDPKEPVPPKSLAPLELGEVVTRKKSVGHKVKSIFFGGEFKEVVSYVTYDVVLPGIRNMLFDTIMKGSRQAIYGPRGDNRYHPGTRGPAPLTSRVQYNNPVRRMSDPRMSGRLPDQPPTGYRQNRREANDIILATKADAEQVLETLENVVDMYGVASLADLYELLNLPQAAIDQKWGWTSLKNTDIRGIREGYLLELPVMEEL